jgi:hypothetical protein
MAVGAGSAVVAAERSHVRPVMADAAASNAMKLIAVAETVAWDRTLEMAAQRWW